MACPAYWPLSRREREKLLDETAIQGPTEGRNVPVVASVTRQEQGSEKLRTRDRETRLTVR